MPFLKEPNPPPDMPNQTVPSACSVTTRTSGEANSGLHPSHVASPESYRKRPCPVPTSKLPPVDLATVPIKKSCSSAGLWNPAPFQTNTPLPQVPAQTPPLESVA